MDVATITLTIAMMGLIILFGTLVAIRMTVTEDTKKLLMLSLSTSPFRLSF